MTGKKRGRPKIFAVPLSNAERQARHRSRKNQQIKSALETAESTINAALYALKCAETKKAAEILAKYKRAKKIHLPVADLSKPPARRTSKRLRPIPKIRGL
jgi:hypothetical protein